MADIRDSDTIPTDEDERVYRKIFTNDDGSCSCEKTGIESARQRRKLHEHDNMFARLERAIFGDSATGFIGMQTMVTTLYERETGESATTDKHVKKEDIEFVRQAKTVIKFFLWLCGAVTGLVLLILAIMQAFK